MPAAEPIDLVSVVAQLRHEGSDTAHVEVKRALGGFPSNLASTLSALANRPGGGVLVLGLDEADDFAPVGVYDLAACQKALAHLGRVGVSPALAPDIQVGTVDGVDVVAALVPETPISAKPCTVATTGKAYVRTYDGDYELSTAEFQAFLGNRDKPTFDVDPVPGTSRDDLDPELVSGYLMSCRSGSPQLSRFDDDDILLKTNVLTADGEVRLAGMLALGLYPQQWFPSLVIQASVAPGPGDPPGTRARDLRVFDGPIPVMLEEAESWVRRNTSYRVVFGADGSGRDVPEYPHDAVRELLTNALVHRDLGPHATNQPITLRVERTRLVISNPGGLWATTLGQLGKGAGPTQRRNEAVVRICQNTRTASNKRVIEGLGDGIRIVLERLDEAGMTQPRFDDRGIAFTVLVPNHALLDPDDIAWVSGIIGNRPATDIQRHVLATMRHGRTWSNRELRAQFPMDSIAARSTLQGLVELGVAEALGEGRGRHYQLAPTVPTEPGAKLDVLKGIPTMPSPPNSEIILDALRTGPRTARDLETATGLTRRQITYALHALRDTGQVELGSGSRGRAFVYELRRPED